MSRFLQKKTINFFLFLVFLFFPFCGTIEAQQLDPLLAKDLQAQEKWVESQLKSLSLTEKIGQLFMIQAYSNKDEKHQKFIESQIKKYHIGGLIFMQGTPENQVRLNNRFQEKSKVPLLVGFDGEWGLDMRLKNTFRFPWNMALGAITNDQYIRQFGKRLGVHCKRMGIHINFAPVVDINTNPDNPIIGNRSFGENKYNVTQKAVAFIKGMQSEGVLANAKHFPGHGDTATDSHKTLPQLTYSLERLNDIELYPYTKIFDAGLASVMVAHLSVPALEVDSNTPTSLSKNVITNLLQQQLGFNGLVFTDALNMKGASNYAKPGEVDLAAFVAGNDMLLIPEDVGAAVKMIKKALKKGVLSPQRLDRSVRKILRAKYLVGLHAYEPIPTEGLETDLLTVRDSVLHTTLVENSITLLQNKEGVFPIKQLGDTRIAYVKLGTAPHETFLNRLQKYKKVTHITATTQEALLEKLSDFDQVIVGYHSSNDNPWKSYKFQANDIAVLKAVAKEHKINLVIFSSPYSLLDLDDFTSIEGVLLAYQNSFFAQETAAQMIFGALETKGRIPVSIGKYFPEGSGINSVNLERLSYGIPESVGMSSERLSKIDSVAFGIIEKKMTPGLQVLVARHGKVIYEKSFGYHTYKKKQKVKVTDVYDLASLTKILGGLPLIMKSEEIGLFDLDDTLGSLLQEYSSSNKDTLTVKEILSHTARLQAWIPFHLSTLDSISQKPLSKYYASNKSDLFSIEVAKDMYMRTDLMDSIYVQIEKAPQRKVPGYKYSGLPFFMFKKYIEETFGTTMDVLAHQFFYKPMGTESLGFLPLKFVDKKRIVPSEEDDYFRHQTLKGHVHDMSAAMMGGVSGNAGLFANANDVAKFMQMYLQGGVYGGHRFLESHTVSKFNKRYFVKDTVRRGLGFDKPQLDPEVKATCGCMSDNSFGHSGFTGTYTWADPDSDLVYVFLSNRTYPTMQNNLLVEEDIRTKVQALVVAAIEE